MDILIGAHGKGKTTLLSELNKSRSDIYTSDGFSRPVKIAGKDLLLNNIKEQILINELTYWRWNQDLGRKNCLFTRSLLDAIVYSRELVPILSIGKLIETFRETHSRLGKIFYIPIEFELKGDGVRFEDVELQKKIDKSFQQIISDYQLPVIEIRGSIEQRLVTILKHI